MGVALTRKFPEDDRDGELLVSVVWGIALVDTGQRIYEE